MTADATVFVVDDDASIRKLLARLLQTAGLHTVTFSSAQAFLEHELPNGPCCLVLDVRLPGLSGLGLQEELARTNRSIPIVFITGHGDVPMTAQAMKAGAVDFLEKPLDSENLLAAVRRALTHDRQHRQVQAQRAVVQQRVDSLTPRERQVLTLVVSGLLNKKIAGELGISEKTVKIHRARVMDKMQAGSLAALVLLAAQVDIHGLAAAAKPPGPD